MSMRKAWQWTQQTVDDVKTRQDIDCQVFTVKEMTQENFPPPQAVKFGVISNMSAAHHLHPCTSAKHHKWNPYLDLKSKCSEFVTGESLAQVQFISLYLVPIVCPGMGLCIRFKRVCIAAWWWFCRGRCHCCVCWRRFLCIFLVCICHWWLSQALAIPNLCIENWIGTEHVQKLLLSKALFVLSHSWRMKWPWRELMKFQVAVRLQHANKF